MRLRFSRATAIVLAAMGSVFIWLLAYGASAAAGLAYPTVKDVRPVNVSPMGATELIVAIVVVAVAVAVALLLIVHSARRTTTAPIRLVAVDRERDQKPKAA